MSKDEFRRLIANQHGVFSVHQAKDGGITKNRLAYLVAQGEASRFLPGVYRLEATPRTFHQFLMGAHVWAGPASAFSHRTAGALLGLCDCDLCVDLTTTRTLRSPDPRIMLFRRPPLLAMDLTRVNGLPVTTMPRTLIDMSAVCSPETVDWALDAAIRAGMPRQLFMMRFKALAAPGRSGISLMRALIAERVHEQGLAESPFERRLLRLLRQAGLPLPVCQFPISDAGFKARVDFAYPDRGLIIEADGYRWHYGRAAFERDRLRWSELASRGWRVVLVTFIQLKYGADEVVARVERALGI